MVSLKKSQLNSISRKERTYANVLSHLPRVESQFFLRTSKLLFLHSPVSGDILRQRRRYRALRPLKGSYFIRLAGSATHDKLISYRSGGALCLHGRHRWCIKGGLFMAIVLFVATCFILQLISYFELLTSLIKYLV